MRAVLVDCPPELIEERRRKGLDLFDEVWEGVYHMPPAPGSRCQDLVLALGALLKATLSGRARVCLGCNVRSPGSGADNFRVPDLSIVSNERAHIVGEAFIEGGPDALIEVRSEGDETYEKLPFCAAMGVGEVLVIEARTSRPEVFRLRGGRYYPLAAAGDGWLESEVLALRLRAGEHEGAPVLLVASAARPDEPSVL